ncbi:hypothetical protein HA052_18860 [Chromobacterium haemolyticum]|uniref:Transposase DDE domain-containing protein n=1 Tax=Chromobacterium fluminis TaxID=3044269 RepID=A0ABX0L614_9NEIS|nr:hypothetical protein [Chromobacterium haemolyticum]
MIWHGTSCGKRGRTPGFSDAAIQVCLAIKCLFNLALRQAVDVEQSLFSLAGWVGLRWTTAQSASDSSHCKW